MGGKEKIRGCIYECGPHTEDICPIWDVCTYFGPNPDCPGGHTIYVYNTSQKRAGINPTLRKHTVG